MESSGCSQLDVIVLQTNSLRIHENSVLELTQLTISAKSLACEYV